MPKLEGWLKAVENKVRSCAAGHSGSSFALRDYGVTMVTGGWWRQNIEVRR
jgi:hypothetical protein